MNQWTFVIAAYVVTFAGLGGLIVGSFMSMRSAERRARDMRDKS